MNLTVASAILFAALAVEARVSCAPAAHSSRMNAEAREHPQMIYGLPHAGDRGFASLDDYLAFLKRLEPIDVPHYEEVEPGLYQYEAFAPHDPAIHRRYTRQELKAKFGFE